QAQTGLPEDIWGWAVMHGRHVNANYRLDGALCGSRPVPLQLLEGSLLRRRLQVIAKHELVLNRHPDDRIVPARVGTIPLNLRPTVMTSDLEAATYQMQAWLLIGMIMLCLCPCVGPLPLGLILAFLSWEDQD
ncbi:unnamed protein product, partial [Polarella glacialis]